MQKLPSGPNAEIWHSLFEEAVFKSKQAGLVKPGDTVVITAGVPLGIAGKTDMIHVVEVV